MKVKSLHGHKVKIPVPGGKDPIIFEPGEEKEVDNAITKKLLESKGFELALEKLSKEGFIGLTRKAQEELLTLKNITFTSKDKESELYKKYLEVD